MKNNIKKKLKKYLPPMAKKMIFKLYGLRIIFLYPKFIRDFLAFKKMSVNSGNRFVLHFKDINPYLGEATSDTGFDSHYVYHPAWAARIIAKTKPEFHTDISSSIYFNAFVSAFVPVKFYDYRPPKLKLPNLEVSHADILKLPFGDKSVKSLSCMHVVEHIGLGRYGDPLDPEGDIKAMKELIRVLAPGGNLLFVVPIGKPQLQFNAHRIYSYDQIIGYFKQLKLKEFSLIRDGIFGGDLVENASKEMADEQQYGCGCFWFVKSN